MAVTGMARLPQLDGIRAIAVSIVIVSHGGLDKFVPGGFGVTIFFFLSGYLITSLLRAENDQLGTISLYNFYVRRLLRITPPLYLTLLFCAAMVALNLVNPGGPLDPLTVFSQFAFFQNYAQLWGNPVCLPITSVWSLAVEEHYYLVFPFLYLLFLRKLSQRTQVLFCIAVSAIALALRFYNVANLQDYSVNYTFTHTRIDSILFGACLALAGNPAIDENAWRPRGWHALIGLGVLATTLLIRNPVFRETLRYTVQGAALYVLFAYVLSSHGWASAVLSSKPAETVARYSYTLYLVHAPMMKLVKGFGLFPNIVAIIIAIVFSFAYAIGMYRWIERPLGRLRHRLHREKVGDLEPALPTL